MEISIILGIVIALALAAVVLAFIPSIRIAVGNMFGLATVCDTDGRSIQEHMTDMSKELELTSPTWSRIVRDDLNYYRCALAGEKGFDLLAYEEALDKLRYQGSSFDIKDAYVQYGLVLKKTKQETALKNLNQDYVERFPYEINSGGLTKDVNIAIGLAENNRADLKKQFDNLTPLNNSPSYEALTEYYQTGLALLQNMQLSDADNNVIIAHIGAMADELGRIRQNTGDIDTEYTAALYLAEVYRQEALQYAAVNRGNEFVTAANKIETLMREYATLNAIDVSVVDGRMKRVRTSLTIASSLCTIYTETYTGDNAYDCVARLPDWEYIRNTLLDCNQIKACADYNDVYEDNKVLGCSYNICQLNGCHTKTTFGFFARCG